MLRYLSKFVVDIMPPVFATVVGAWIVTHYITPKANTAAPKVEVSVSDKVPLRGASGMAPRAVEQVAVKPVADEAAEGKRAVREKPAKPQAVVSSRSDEKREAPRDATDLARAALDRLKSQTPEPAHVPQATIQPVSQPVPAPAAPVAVAPPTPVAAPAMPVNNMATAAPPALPPPVVIAPQREATVQPSPSLFGESGRPTPPVDIPMRSADAAMEPNAREGRSLIGGIASAARSLVDVVIPR